MRSRAALLLLVAACGGGEPHPPVDPVDLTGEPLVGPRGPAPDEPTEVLPAPAPAPIEPTPGGPREVDWELLGGYEFLLPDPRAGSAEVPPDQIPPHVLDLDGARVRIKGHLLPERFDADTVEAFTLHRYYGGCCYGEAPGMNDWIAARVAGAPMPYRPYEEVFAIGTLEVGEIRTPDGFVESVYRMTVEELDWP